MATATPKRMPKIRSSARIVCQVDDCKFNRKRDGRCRRTPEPLLVSVCHGGVRREFVCRGFALKGGA
jgi:hypothetical protein